MRLSKRTTFIATGGFTLVELMLAMAVGTIVMAAVMGSFASQHRSYLAQNDVIAMQQNARVAMDLLIRDIRSAGFDPENRGAGITVAAANSLTFTRENDTNTGLETIAYSLYDAYATVPANDGLVDDLARQITDAGGASAGRQAVAEDISQLAFRYLDSNGEITANLANIRSIQVSMLVTPSKPEPDLKIFNNLTYTSTYTSPSGVVDPPINWGPFNDNLRRRLYVTTIQCRNLGL